MAKHTKKPVTIDAVQVTAADFNGSTFDGSPFSESPEWLIAALEAHTLVPVGQDTDYAVWDVRTTEGVMRAVPGDWIIRGVKGELYPCKPDIFAASYMPASREADATGKPAITRAEADAGLSDAPAPRVTVEDMEAKVASAEYFRSKTLTICILTLANGFAIVGKSACASPENYDQAKGERYAYDDAFRQIWAFEGYLLRERLAAA